MRKSYEVRLGVSRKAERVSRKAGILQIHTKISQNAVMSQNANPAKCK